MLNYARQRAREALGHPHAAVLVTQGPAGVRASEFPCETWDLDFYLLLPQTSDHLFNLEHGSAVTLLIGRCEIKGTARLISQRAPERELALLKEPGAAWCALVQVEISQIQIRSEQGWGNLETIDL